MILEGDIGNIMKKEISSDDIGGRYWKYHEKKRYLLMILEGGIYHERKRYFQMILEDGIYHERKRYF